MKFEDLTPEQQSKAKACKTSEELVALAQAEGFDLSDEQLEALSGGINWSCAGRCEDDNSCPDYYCGDYGHIGL